MRSDPVTATVSNPGGYLVCFTLHDMVDSAVLIMSPSPACCLPGVFFFLDRECDCHALMRARFLLLRVTGAWKKLSLQQKVDLGVIYGVILPDSIVDVKLYSFTEWNKSVCTHTAFCQMVYTLNSLVLHCFFFNCTGLHCYH